MTGEYKGSWEQKAQGETLPTDACPAPNWWARDLPTAAERQVRALELLAHTFADALAFWKSRTP